VSCSKDFIETAKDRKYVIVGMSRGITINIPKRLTPRNLYRDIAYDVGMARDRPNTMLMTHNIKVFIMYPEKPIYPKNPKKLPKPVNTLPKLKRNHSNKILKELLKSVSIGITANATYKTTILSASLSRKSFFFPLCTKLSTYINPPV